MRHEPAASSSPVDWWPFARLLITAVVLGLAAHVFLGWQVRAREVPALSGQMFGVMSILAMISFVLADLYLLVFLIPLLIVGVLNDWSYGASVWALRTVFRMRSGRSLSFAGLCGEIILFGFCLIVLGRFVAKL